MARDEKSAPEEQIKVVDRRLFDADGNPRTGEERAGAEAPRAVEPPPPPPEPKERRAAAPEPPLVHPGPHEERFTEAHGDLPGEGDEGPVSGEAFIGLVMSLSVNALMALGHAPGAAAGEAPVDLVAARQLIDILAMLAEKTEGNLSSEEARVLDQNLYDLRMMYVEKTRGGPSR